jgi:putative ABC transport system permease protein
MLRNHIKSILRNLRRQKGHAAINITGLAIGFASATLIAIYVFQELTYDQYYKDHERIYRLSAKNFALSSIAHLNLLENKVPGVEAVTNVMPNPSGTLKKGVTSFIEKDVYYGTDGYLKVFEQPFVYGNPETAFDAPNAILLSASMAQKLFGTSNPIGEELTLSTQISTDAYQVTGVVEDLPGNVHLKWQVLARLPQEFESNIRDSFSFTTGYSYFKYQTAVPAAAVQSRTDEVFARRNFEEWGNGETFEEYLEKARNGLPWVLNIADVHLHSDIQFEAEPPGKANYLYIFMGIAIFIIVLAAINYVNLATAQASKRAKEVGVRKVLGSVRADLISRFLTESVLLTMSAVVIGLGLAEASLALLRNLGFGNFGINVFDFPQLIALMLFSAVATGLIAGIYPAFYLTSFRPSSVLKGDYKAAGQSKWFRNSLVLFQYVVSLTLTVFAIFIYQQLNFSLEKDLGFNKENILVIDNSKSQLGQDDESTEPFRNELLGNPAIADASYSAYSMVNQLPLGGLTEKNGEETYWRIQYKYTDDHFISTMGFRLLEGRDFDSELDKDRTAMIVNETFARQLGGEVLGKRFDAGVNGKDVRIVGIVEDYHYQDMTSAIGPTAFYFRSYPAQLSVRISGGEVAKTIKEIEATYAEFSDEPLDYYFFDQQFDQLFSREKSLGQIVTIFTGLAVFVALLGLVGLISYKLDQRIREIGIRKVLGASVRQIISLFSKELTWLVAVAFLVTIPLGFYITSAWLSSFAYHIDIQWLPFVTVGVVAISVTLLIVFLRTLKAALMNPTVSLRNE